MLKYQKIVSLCCSLFACSALAAPLPEPLAQALEKSGFPASSVALHIAPLDAPGATIQLNADVPMKPASVIKVVTTAAALDIFKPNHAWYTDVTARAKPDAKGVVRGVTLVGGGDPHLMVERLWLVAERLRAAGVRRLGHHHARKGNALGHGVGVSAARRRAFSRQNPHDCGAVRRLAAQH